MLLNVEWKHTQNLKSNSYFLTKGAHLDIYARFFYKLFAKSIIRLVEIEALILISSSIVISFFSCSKYQLDYQGYSWPSKGSEHN